MDQLECIAAFSSLETVSDYLFFVSLSRSLQEKQQLYSCTPFQINSIPENNFCYLFRFNREDIVRLHAALQLPSRCLSFSENRKRVFLATGPGIPKVLCARLSLH